MNWGAVAVLALVLYYTLPFLLARRFTFGGVFFWYTAPFALAVTVKELLA